MIVTNIIKLKTKILNYKTSGSLIASESSHIQYVARFYPSETRSFICSNLYSKNHIRKIKFNCFDKSDKNISLFLISSKISQWLISSTDNLYTKTS